uniref:putative disease resistance RPP13-like protein 1 n=1 Tax=Fragaria vesca subsp. vesca TaxID=101020 RepID=UPI0005C8E184|nr:PREDICTED: putative disease resistance RPP13-like protein 1 [Fragaria vesca subsp. vesca]XP_011470064.1 PREDICTED: putative disease resistance RPP13-like protein 1 [Fragaria vesca subsp. vesca]
MGEAVLGAFLPVLLKKLADQEITEYFGRLKGVDKKVLEKWTRTLTAVEAVLSDAEEKQLTQSRVKLWLDDLRDLAYDVQDVLDIFDTKMLKRRIERQQGSKSKLWSSLSKVKSNFDLNSAIKKISDRLEEITTRKKQFGLKELDRPTKKPWKMPLTTSQPDGPVIGRDEANDKILYDLLSKEEKYHVVGIVGTGGLGKTTLAKHVFNDAATGQFSPKGWVSVSDDFDIVRVAAAVLESVTSAPVQVKELNSILEKLSKELAGKKFLIVLDDVWDTCSYGHWTTLQASFRVGAAGSKIIVTTRDANVANMMGDRSPYNLKPMSEDDCWRLFQHHALLNNRPEDVEFLKGKIVEKCNGLPLAARTLGGLLRCKEVDEWEDILDHKMWTLSDQNKMDILPALKLSYHYLPSTLKRCFSYCAILPNDYEFKEMQLILWWMAEGLIPQQPKEHKQMEDLGRDYFQELVSRSLFQKSSKTESRYIMHDLVTDLARWAAGSSCCRLEDMQNYDSQQHSCLPKIRHSSYILGVCDGVKKFEVYSEAICLRTFLPLSLGSLPDSHYLAQKVTSNLFPKLQYLRLLSLKSYQIIELPDTIGELKHLRYLDLSHTGIRSLPDSTTTLYNLQTLLLESCHQLKALPTSMRNLVNLRHLNNSGTRSLEEMPPQLGQLTNLQTLPEFVIGKGSGSGVREIESLLHLQGTLHISRLENVICVEDARSANCLKSKERLEALFLEWSSSSVSTEDAAIVLDMLQPHSKLKKLTIKDYGGSKFSTWIGNPSFTKMVRVKLEGCNHCQLLPPFGQLPCLKELCIQEMDAVESVGVEFYGEGKLSFRALETLELHNLKNWKKWYPCQQSEGVEVFSCLKKLSIRGCPKLEGDLPEKLDSLAQLEIYGCEELVVSVSKYKQLHGSNIEKCKMVVYDTSTVQFELLESLTYSNVSELRFQTESFMKSLKNVKELKITRCEELTCCFQNEDRLLQHLISLSRLYIEDNSILVEKLGIEAEQLLQLQILDCNIERLELSKCGSLVKVPEGLHHLRSLQELHISGCSSLVSFPDVGLPPCLQELHISECSSLVSFPDVGLPPCLQDIVIQDCESLLHFAKYQIPPSLKRIDIWNCGNLKSLIEKEEEVGNGSSSSCLESLWIRNCPSSMCLLCKGQLPGSLKQLVILRCGQLELITERFLDDSCQLEEIDIENCPNLKSLPEGLCHLTNLQSLIVYDCQSLVSLPRMNVWPRMIGIRNCDKLEVAQLARDMMHTSNLEDLRIDYFEGLTTTTSFPTNLTSLSIDKIKNCKALMEFQGLQRLASLRELYLWGEDDGGLVSFPPAAENSKETEILLPRSLVDLSIVDFPNLKKLSKGFQFLTSLERLWIWNCPKLTTLPVEEGLPLSLVRLDIYNCPLLEQRYKGRYRHKIAHIPEVRINLELI